MQERGFVTIATGKDEYYKIAVNLLRSYKCFTKNPLPFAIIADKENDYTKLFDKVIILENPHFSYTDKIELLNNIPFKETIFIESDCLAYADLNIFFDAFQDADDFSCFGYSKPITSEQCGWFKLEETGKYRSQVKYYQGIHSGVIFLRNTDVCKQMYDISKDLWENFSEYNIGGSLDMLDDKLFAVSSAVIPCKMTANNLEGYAPFCVYPYSVNNHRHPKPKLLKGSVTFIDDDGVKVKGLVCHWGNNYTKRTLYKREVAAISLIEKKGFKTIAVYIYYNCVLPFSYLKRQFLKLFWKIMNISFIKKPIKKILKLLHIKKNSED